MTEPEFNTKFTDEPICPHCGYEMRDSWELGLGPGKEDTETDCGECEKPMDVHVYVTYYYTTSKLKGEK